jgi:hypothetical protein
MGVNVPPKQKPVLPTAKTKTYHLFLNTQIFIAGGFYFYPIFR